MKQTAHPFSTNHFLHGGDYNPDQWLDRPDILEKDLEYFEKAGINCVSLGIFSWAMLEPEEGHYQFDWMKEIIDRLILSNIPKGRPRNFDYKTAFQELVQRKKDQQIHYELTGESGPDHNKLFTFRVLINGVPAGEGSGRSKKEAEQMAACKALEALKQ